MAGIMGPVRAPKATELLTTVGVRFNEKFGQYLQLPAYSDYDQLVAPLDPTGDDITVIYSHPGVGMQEWITRRAMTEVDFKYFNIAVRRWGLGFVVDLDDVRDDANPAKRLMYLQAAQNIAYSAGLLYPDLLVAAIHNGLTKTWLPDGQPIWGSHSFDPDGIVSGTFRNYYSKTVQGGSAAYPLTYGNLLAVLKQGQKVKMPNGRAYPVRYDAIFVGPNQYPEAVRLATYDRLPVGEVLGQTLATTSAGGDTINQIAKTYAPKVLQVAGLGDYEWGVASTAIPDFRMFGLKKRDPITQDFTGAWAADMLPSDSAHVGLVTPQVFDTNSVSWGVRARADVTALNWWGAIFCDGTP